MTDTLIASSAPLFRFSVLQSLTAISCLGCMYTCGLNVGLHVATASATFVFCTMREFPSVCSEELETAF